MSRSLNSVLCGEPWVIDDTGNNSIKFRDDGTGDLHCNTESCPFIAAQFVWTPLDSLHTPIHISDHVRGSGSEKVVDFDIEMTLTARRVDDLANWMNELINEHALTEAAFRPKKYHLKLEKGVFMTPLHTVAGIRNESTQYFHLLLVFDQSPYPARGEWKEPEAGPDQNKFWDWKEFAGRNDSSLQKHLPPYRSVLASLDDIYA